MTARPTAAQRREARDRLDVIAEALQALDRTGVPMVNHQAANAADDITRAIRTLRGEVQLLDREAAA